MSLRGDGLARPRKGGQALCAARKPPLTSRYKKGGDMWMDTGTAVSTISSLVSSVGFPIVCVFICLYLIWSMNNKYNTQTEKWIEIITNNTEALNALIRKLEGDKDDS